MAHDRVQEILSWYDFDNAGVRTNLARILMHGRLGGSGKLVILPVDQGFEHGPTRSFSAQPSGFDPRYHARLAIAAGCSAYAAPPGAIAEAAVDLTAGLPLIMKVNSSDVLYQDSDPLPAVTGTVDEALRLGCSAVGFTIYPGSAARIAMYEQLRTIAEDARSAGLAVVVWAYPRGSGLSEAGQTAVDVISYAAHIAAQLGAHIIKVKPPTAHVEFDSNRSALQKSGFDFSTLSGRVAHVVRSAFDGRRIVIFSGGPAKDREAVLEENRQTATGGGFGAIVGRNSFQRPWDDAIRLLHDIMDIHAQAAMTLDLRVPA
jgi:class I fructose-bisphosphate aldolase